MRFLGAAYLSPRLLTCYRGLLHFSGPLVTAGRGQAFSNADRAL
jgi:hypothetical protein